MKDNAVAEGGEIVAVSAQIPRRLHLCLCEFARVRGVCESRALALILEDEFGKIDASAPEAELTNLHEAESSK